MRTLLLLIGLGACVDGPLVAPDNRHLDIPRGAGREVGLDAVDSAVSSDPAIATATIVGGDVRVTGTREGDALISIEHAGQLTSVVAHVTPPAIVQLAVAPDEMTTVVGTAIAIHAYATDTTGAITDVTQLASWRIEDPTIASLGSGGALVGMTLGETVLHAAIVDAVAAVPIYVR